MAKSAKSVPRPEHPRPLLERKEWLNLNGEWQFAFDDADQGVAKKWFQKKSLGRTITVPFAYQTEASGINEKAIHEVVWYKRLFAVPKGWKSSSVLLHFGAVDYKSTIWINGQEVGHNRGGHVPFSFDITAFLVEGENSMTVRVQDPQDATQPRGKQSVTGVPHSVDYYCTTGIWQTVWLEAVPTMRIDDVRITPVTNEQSFLIVAVLHAPSSSWKLEATVLDGKKVVTRAEKWTSKAVIRLEVPIPDAKLWTPDNPHLYTFQFKLYSSDKLCDEVQSYGGLRNIAIKENMLLLNGEPTYLAMVLDQGYWPEGGMTALTDEALKADVEWTKKLGFNGSRKHQKVEDPRWLYWCDKLGLLVWSEMANAREWTPEAEERLMAEWERAVRRNYNHPSIIAWVPMNESWGVPGLHQDHPVQFAYLEKIVTLTRRIDSTRPIIDNDGWEHTDITDICAIHDYSPTAMALTERYQQTVTSGALPATILSHIRIPIFARTSEYHGQPVIFSETGGFLMIPPDLPEDQLDYLYSLYGTVRTADDMMRKYTDLVMGLLELPFLSGYCYTQLTDVEHEINGLLTKKRESKLPVQKVAALNKLLIAEYIRRNKILKAKIKPENFLYKIS